MTSAVPASPEQRTAFQRVSGASEGAGLEPLPGFPASEIWHGYDPAPYIAKHLLGPGELTVLFGQSGHFKSALAIDLALSVALGQPFHGFKVRQAGVLYVAGEGHGGLKKRIRAWMLARGMHATSEQPCMYVTKIAASLIGNPEGLRVTVEHATRQVGREVGLVVVDTLAANFGPGDENTANDMALAIAGARSSAPNAAVLMVHHTGHGQGERERGSSALAAAADYRLQATYDDISKMLELRWLKVKDDERPEPAAFTWRRVALEWFDEDGEELSSVALDRLEGACVTRGPRSAGLGKNQELALNVLHGLQARYRKNLQDNGRDPAEARILIDGWRRQCEARGMKRNRFHEVSEDLQTRKLIHIEGLAVVLSEEAP